MVRSVLSLVLLCGAASAQLADTTPAAGMVLTTVACADADARSSSFDCDAARGITLRSNDSLCVGTVSTATCASPPIPRLGAVACNPSDPSQAWSFPAGLAAGPIVNTKVSPQSDVNSAIACPGDTWPSVLLYAKQDHRNEQWQYDVVSGFIKLGPSPGTCLAYRAERPTPNNATVGATCSMSAGQDCIGDDVSNQPADTPQACCEACSSTVGCAGFTHNQYNGAGQKVGTCYLKSACPSMQGCGTCTAGTATPAAPTPPPTPPVPTPPTPAPPTPPPAPGATLYCPGAADWSAEYGNVALNGTGWSIHGGGRVASKAAFNLLGGFVEFDMDTRGALTGVNNNFYLTSPTKAAFPAYCDIQQTPGCLEMDIVENNGNCVAQTTWHTTPIGRGNCDRGGCEGQKYITGGGRFHIKAAFSADGWMTVTMDGGEIAVSNPTPNDDAKGYVRDTLGSLGGQIHSSQWTGWVPGGNCPGGGSLDNSVFGVYNVRIMGAVVQGGEPARC
jgi:hypothetical protein